MSLTAKHITVTGKVQGVFFRKYTRETALNLNITGWVRNTDNGHVEIFAQADEEAVKKLIEWCWQGSPGAKVSGVVVKPAQPDDSLQAFLIYR